MVPFKGFKFLLDKGRFRVEIIIETILAIGGPLVDVRSPA